MFINSTIELTTMLDNEKYEKLFSRICSISSCIEENDEGYIDNSLADKGIVVLLRNSQYKKKARLIVKPCIMLDSEEPDSEKLIRKLNKRIGEYFGGQYHLSDFTFPKVTLTTDIDVHSRENVSAYLKVPQRIGKVKGFSPVTYDCFDKGTSFCLEGNSNGIDFLVYDLEKVLLGQYEPKSTYKKKMNPMIEGTKGVLRVEVRLTSSKSIQNFTDRAETSEQIREISNIYEDIFLKTFAHIVPYGDFYKKDKAIELVRENAENSVLRRKMIRLIALIPEKKSLWLAQKAMGSRDMDRIMEEFGKMELVPVTIDKRNKMKQLKNIYSYLFNEN